MSDYDPHYVEQKVFARIGQKAIVTNGLTGLLQIGLHSV
jgi:hypothetical protein